MKDSNIVRMANYEVLLDWINKFNALPLRSKNGLYIKIGYKEYGEKAGQMQYMFHIPGDTLGDSFNVSSDNIVDLIHQMKEGYTNQIEKLRKRLEEVEKCLNEE